MIYFTKDIFTIVPPSKYFSIFGGYLKIKDTKVDYSYNINLLNIPLSDSIILDEPKYIKFLNEKSIARLLDLIINDVTPKAQILSIMDIFKKYFPEKVSELVKKLSSKNFNLNNTEDIKIFKKIFGEEKFKKELKNRIKIDPTYLLLNSSLSETDADLITNYLMKKLLKNNSFFGDSEECDTIEHIYKNFNRKIRYKTKKYPKILLKSLCRKIGPQILDYIEFDLEEDLIKILFAHLPGKYLIRFEEDYYEDNKTLIETEIDKLDCILNTSSLHGIITNSDLVAFKIKIPQAIIISKN